ncbi:MAG: glutaminyl-peptide cyclotransferase [Actinomycetota bacterium]|nr:glutaminyl-peptide cyclotransferase [Actinomycetota bacterium]MDD5667963.1 glutaminyl-peptide cyclotransferase [Actinomycetota bacterium]
MPIGRFRRQTAFALACAVLALLACFLLFLTSCGGSVARLEPDAAADEERERSREFLAGREAPVYSYEVIEVYAHGSEDFTEGLVMDGGILFEGTGLRGQSRLIKTDLRSGEVLDVLELDPEYFGEGVTVLGGEVFQLTYTSGLGFVYDRDSLELKRSFSYASEGWGLTHDGKSLIMSDGSPALYFLDPASGTETGRVNVSDNLGPLSDLNELEYVAGEIYANIWHTSLIAIISPASGDVTGWVDLAGLNPDPSRLRGEYVLNGIAWVEESGHLLVTGKNWPHIYEIRLSPPSL